MGPRPFGRGNSVRGSVPVVSVSLQWGRGLSAAETGHAICADTKVYIASMGPRPFGRGNSGSQTRCSNIRLLQWGRGLSAAETRRLRVPVGLKAPASMGARGLSAAETCSAGRDRSALCSFNGAAAFRPRKQQATSTDPYNETANTATAAKHDKPEESQHCIYTNDRCHVDIRRMMQNLKLQHEPLVKPNFDACVMRVHLRLSDCIASLCFFQYK